MGLVILAGLGTCGMFPAVASEPTPDDPQRPAWVYAGLIIIATGVVLGGVLLGVAHRWRRERWRVRSALEVRVFHGGPGDQRNTWVRVIDPISGAIGESTTEQTIGANQERALDLLMEQLGR